MCALFSQTGVFLRSPSPCGRARARQCALAAHTDGRAAATGQAARGSRPRASPELAQLPPGLSRPPGSPLHWRLGCRRPSAGEPLGPRHGYAERGWSDAWGLLRSPDPYRGPAGRRRSRPREPSLVRARPRPASGVRPPAPNCLFFLLPLPPLMGLDHSLFGRARSVRTVGNLVFLRILQGPDDRGSKYVQCGVPAPAFSSRKAWFDVSYLPSSTSLRILVSGLYFYV